MPPPLPPVIILCGGFGTRLRETVADRPKVLADVAGRPFLAYLLDRLTAQGATDVILSAGYRADQVETFTRISALPGLALRVVTESKPLGTAGALRFAAEAASVRGDFLALNGDTYFSGSMRRLADERARSGSVAMVALVHVPDTARYGSVSFDAHDGAVRAFEEKGATGAGWINAGAYALSPGALADLPVGTPASLERDVLPALVGRGLVGLPYPDAVFLDIGTPEHYARADAILQARSPS